MEGIEREVERGRGRDGGREGGRDGGSREGGREGGSEGVEWEWWREGGGREPLVNVKHRSLKFGS